MRGGGTTHCGPAMVEPSGKGVGFSTDWVVDHLVWESSDVDHQFRSEEGLKDPMYALRTFVS